MFFDTPVFFVFLTIVLIAYWRLRWRSQNLLLLVASYIFYGWWDWRFLSLIFISTVVDFFCAQYIERSDSPARRRGLLALSVTLNLGFLGVFKYFNFFVDSFSDVMGALGIHIPKATLSVLLPPGISFYTFQAVAYIVDVYYRRLTSAKSPIDYALFISFFPHLIAGPIQRPSHLLPQVQTPRQLDYSRFFGGLMLIVFGLFQKCVIADNCSLMANAAFGGKLGEPNLAVLAIGAYAFAWQIYGDFSGYSNIARGAAQLFGFHFMVNFRQPYLATSLKDFWRRWHISLSTWLRDYLYVSLGGNRHGNAKTHRNLILTMLIGGLWHGANWTFVIWGAIHGVGQSIGRFFGNLFSTHEAKHENPSHSFWSIWWRRLFIFHLVCFSWVFFRAQSLGDAIHFLSGVSNIKWLPEYRTAILLLVMFSLPMFLIDVVNEKREEEYLFEKAHPYTQVLVAIMFLVGVLFFAGNTANAFIYFQF